MNTELRKSTLHASKPPGPVLIMHLFSHFDVLFINLQKHKHTKSCEVNKGNYRHVHMLVVVLL